LRSAAARSAVAPPGRSSSGVTALRPQWWKRSDVDIGGRHERDSGQAPGGPGRSAFTPRYPECDGRTGRAGPIAFVGQGVVRRRSRPTRPPSPKRLPDANPRKNKCSRADGDSMTREIGRIGAAAVQRLRARASQTRSRHPLQIVAKASVRARWVPSLDCWAGGRAIRELAAQPRPTAVFSPTTRRGPAASAGPPGAIRLRLSG
jgi:hypothetical protein